MNEEHDNARDHFYEAIRALAASASPIQIRLARALVCIVPVEIQTFDGQPELKLRFARILDHVAPDIDDIAVVGTKNAANMSDDAAVTVASLICDFYDDLAS